MKEQIDVPKALAEVFKRLGGIAEMAKWAKSHKTFFYNHYVKMLPTQVAAQVDVHATVHDADEARQKLQTAFMNLIRARQEDAAEQEVKTGVRIINGVPYRRVEGATITDQTRGDGPITIHDVAASFADSGAEDDQADVTHGTGHATIDADRTTIDGGPSTRGVDEPSGAADPSARDARHATADQEQASTVDGSADQNKSSNHPQQKGSLGRGGPRSDHSTSVQVQPVSNESTTELYLKWMEGPGGARHRWGPI